MSARAIIGSPGDVRWPDRATLLHYVQRLVYTDVDSPTHVFQRCICSVLSHTFDAMRTLQLFYVSRSLT